MSTEAIAYLITISSSSIDSPVTHARLACSLPYTWANMPHNYFLYPYYDNGQRYTHKTYKRHMGRAPAELKSVFPLGKSPVLVVDPDPAAPEEQPRVVTESRLIPQSLTDNYAQGN